MRAWRRGPSGRGGASGTGALRTGAFVMTMLASTLWLTATLVKPRRAHRLPTPSLAGAAPRLLADWALSPPPLSSTEGSLLPPALPDVTQSLAASSQGTEGLLAQPKVQEAQGTAAGGEGAGMEMSVGGGAAAGGGVAGLEMSVGRAEPETEPGGTAQEGEKREAEEEEVQSPPPSPPPAPVLQPPPPPSIALRYVNYPGAKTCGPRWADSYARMHRSIRRAELPRRFITFKGPSGPLGEQLMGVASTFVAALVTKRALIIAAPQIRSTFVVGLIDWTPREFVPLEPTKDCATAEECAALAVTEEEGTGRVVRVDLRNAYEPDFTGWIGRFPLEVGAFLRPLENYTNIVVLVNSGVLARVFSTQSATRTALEALNIIPETAFACIIRFIMRPRDRVLRMAAPYLESYLPLAKQSVCVHLASVARFEALSPGEQLSLFQRVKTRELACAVKVGEKLHRDQERTTWVVIADSRQFQAMLQGWSTSLDRVNVLTNDLLLASNASARGASDASVAEWLAFTACGAYVIPHNGFSKTAYAYSLRNPVAFLLSLGADAASHEAPCDPANPATLADLQPFTGL